MKLTIKYDSELTPAALLLVEQVEARQARAEAKSARLKALKEAARRVDEAKGKGGS